MAPIKKRTSMRARTASSKASPKLNVSDPDSATSAADLSALRLNKQDKRHLKHAALMHKVRDASVSKSSAGKKRPRPAKKMQAAESLGGLRDALAEMEGDDEEWEGLRDGDGDEREQNGQVKVKRRPGEGKIKMRSLQHRPGAMKRKQALEKREQDRFRRNLAQLAANEQHSDHDGGVKGTRDAGEDAAGQGPASKWAALRAFIGGTMEKDKAFGTG